MPDVGQIPLIIVELFGSSSTCANCSTLEIYKKRKQKFCLKHKSVKRGPTSPKDSSVSIITLLMVPQVQLMCALSSGKVLN